MPVTRIKALWIGMAVFCISMAYVESAVVVYLRELYYPDGFSFPLVSMSPHIAFTEIFRELATLFMLMTAGYLAGKNTRQRFAWFIMAFAIWDIFYYIFLKLLLNWPESWLTWDILFLIPVLWTGPVLVPVIVSLTMILLAAAILYADNKINSLKIKGMIWLFIVIGSVMIFLSCIWDFSSYVVSRNAVRSVFNPDYSSAFLRLYVPSSFNWILFLAGEAAELTGILLLFTSYRNKPSRIRGLVNHSEE